MKKQVFERKQNALAILVVFFVVISMTAAVVSTADEIHNSHPSGHHPGNHHQGRHHFHNWHDHHHHHYHDHYYNGIYYSDYEWVHNPVTLLWDWTYVPIVKEQPVVVEQPVVEQSILATRPTIERQVGARPVGASPAIGTGLVTPATPGLITDATYGPSAPATPGFITDATYGTSGTTTGSYF